MPTSPPRAAQLGEFWLWQRTDRGSEWCICWYDKSARTTRRLGTGVRGSPPDRAPKEAVDALARHYATAHEPPRANAAAADAGVLPILTAWLHQLPAEKGRTAAYSYAVQQLVDWFIVERDAGRLPAQPSVADMRRATIDRFIAHQLAKGRAPATVSGDLAALRAALRWAHREEMIAAAPFVPEVPKESRSGPRTDTFAIEEVAAILTAARADPARWHVHRFTMAMLAGTGRIEAVLECDLDVQLDRQRWLLDWRRPREQQTSKRRPIVPVPPIWRPWLAEACGKLVRYRVETKRESWADPNVPEYHERDTSNIKTTWPAVLEAAGVAYRPPNTLRHTIHSELDALGVPEAQIDLAFGHAGDTTGKRNYRHFRPEYQRELSAGIENYFQRMDAHTEAHLRYQRDTNGVPMLSANPEKRCA